MATRLLDTQRIDRIREQARPVDFGRLLLNLLLGLFWLLGWLVGMISVGLGFAWAAATTGYSDARTKAGRPPRAGSG